MNKIALLLAVVALTGTAIFFSSSFEKQNEEGMDLIMSEFNTFRTKYKKVYATQSDASYRMKVFKTNLELINKHNSDQSQTYTLGVNQFSDMTFEEFKKFYLTENSDDSFNMQEGSEFYFGENSKGESVDWREKGIVKGAKNQARCGSCWAFAAASVVEQQYALAGSEILVSEQELVDCAGAYGNQGCNGGLAPWALSYVLDKGINLAKDYPYQAVTRKCTIPKEGEIKISRFVVLPAGPDFLIERLKKGTSTVSFSVQQDFMSYKSGIYNPKSCPNPRNHAVNAVGFDTTGEIPYFIIRNSWSANWGENGFFKIAIKDGNGTCTITGEGRSSSVNFQK